MNEIIEKIFAIVLLTLNFYGYLITENKLLKSLFFVVVIIGVINLLVIAFSQNITIYIK